MRKRISRTAAATALALAGLLALPAHADNTRLRVAGNLVAAGLLQQQKEQPFFEAFAKNSGLAIDMDFQVGDVQWLLNYAALHSRTSYDDWPEKERRRHLLRLWLKRDVGRPLVDKFGKHVVTMGAPVGGLKPGGRFKIAEAAAVNDDWGN